MKCSGASAVRAVFAGLASDTPSLRPHGLATLVLTEMWERFTFYGMRAILILFMVAATSDGGMGMGDKAASAVYGLYLAGSYVFALLGGWMADRLLGARRAVIIGGAFIVVGNAMLVFHDSTPFFVGLCVNVLGVGLLKPNVSALVAALYPEGGARRDSGFSIFYMGINGGAFLGAMLVPVVASRLGWHWGFATAAVGMLAGLIQFQRATRGMLTLSLPKPPRLIQTSWSLVAAFLGAFVLIAVVVDRTHGLDVIGIAAGATWLIALVATIFFGYMLLFAGLTTQEKRRVYVMAALFVACATFWAGFEQVGSSFSLFASRYTDRSLLGWQIPAGVLLAVNPLLIITLSPIFAALWLSLGRREHDISAPVKFSFGLLLMGMGFLVMYFAARNVMAGGKVAPTWLLATYALHTCGELCLSPVGLSFMTKLAPSRWLGQAVGVWFLAAALGNNLAGQLSGEYDATNVQSLPSLFLKIFWWGFVSGVALLLISPILKRMTSGVR